MLALCSGWYRIAPAIRLGGRWAPLPQMPVVDGIEATRRLAGPTVDGPAVPKVLIVTTFNLDEYVYQALRAGASGFLLK